MTFGITDQPIWRGEYQQWRQAFVAAMGQPIAFMHVDINWGTPTGRKA